jgi:hypothetical protein
MMTPHNTYRPLSRRARALAVTLALVASCASLSVVVGLFDSAGSTPWFAADQAGLVAHCEPVRAATQRHTCLQAVAQQVATTRVATR